MSKSFTAADVAEALKSGREFSITGVGKLKVKTAPARQSRNPRTGETVQVPERRVVKFSMSSTMKAELNQ